MLQVENKFEILRHTNHAFRDNMNRYQRAVAAFRYDINNGSQFVKIFEVDTLTEANTDQNPKRKLVRLQMFAEEVPSTIPVSGQSG